MVLLVQPASLHADTNAMTSSLITVTGSQGDTCLVPGSPSVTLKSAVTASSTVTFKSSTAAPAVATLPTTTADTSPLEATKQARKIK